MKQVKFLALAITLGVFGWGATASALTNKEFLDKHQGFPVKTSQSKLANSIIVTKAQGLVASLGGAVPVPAKINITVDCKDRNGNSQSHTWPNAGMGDAWNIYQWVDDNCNGALTVRW